jgi:hypothetical protein
MREMPGAIDPDAIEECIPGQAAVVEAADRQQGSHYVGRFLARPLTPETEKIDPTLKRRLRKKGF